MNQVLSNLISNALRHTSSGGMVSIRTEWAADKKDHRLRIFVHDTGS
ncbi:MAG: sensor histidine kinase, partial [Chloroflexi bacterium]|nr:sensor histidine kinase [Chloroflexota bacterium]